LEGFQNPLNFNQSYRNEVSGVFKNLRFLRNLFKNAIFKDILMNEKHLTVVGV